jgi:hypothetical protein
MLASPPAALLEAVVDANEPPLQPGQASLSLRP